MTGESAEAVTSVVKEKKNRATVSIPPTRHVPAADLKQTAAEKLAACRLPEQLRPCEKGSVNSKVVSAVALCYDHLRVV